MTMTGRGNSHQVAEINPVRKVTIFGDGSPVDQDLAQQLISRGAETAIVTVPIGWPDDVKFAIARVDTTAGVDALRDLAHHELAAARVICTCENPQSLESARAIRTICVDCSTQNLITLLWHPPVGASMPDSQGEDQYLGSGGPEIRPADLAFVVAREYMTTRRKHLIEQSVVLDEAGRAT